MTFRYLYIRVQTSYLKSSLFYAKLEKYFSWWKIKKQIHSPCALKSQNTKYNREWCVLHLTANPCTTIISCYSSTNASDETDIIANYNELSFFARCFPKHNVLIIGGDMNAQIGKDENNKFYLPNSLNRNGEYRTDFSLENKLTCLNTKFQKREENLWTFTYFACSSAGWAHNNHSPASIALDLVVQYKL